MKPHLREVLAQARSAQARASSFFALHRARLKLGVALGVTFGSLDDTLRRFVAAQPDTEILVQDDRPAALREALVRGDHEVIVPPQRPHEPDELHYHPLGQERLFATLPEAHGFAAQSPVPLAALAGEPLVCGNGCLFWGSAERAFREQGIEVTPKAVVAQPDWLFELVGAGVGVGLTARHADLPPGLVGRPVEGAAVAHVINLATKRGRLSSPSVEAFVDLALKPRRQPQAVASAA